MLWKVTENIITEILKSCVTSTNTVLLEKTELKLIMLIWDMYCDNTGTEKILFESANKSRNGIVYEFQKEKFIFGR